MNDVTAVELLDENPEFAQWCRAKGFDTFAVLGPVITVGFDWPNAHVVTRLDGVERQNYPLSDMIIPPPELVSRISHDMSLLPGDVIAAGRRWASARSRTAARWKCASRVSDRSSTCCSQRLDERLALLDRTTGLAAANVRCGDRVGAARRVRSAALAAPLPPSGRLIVVGAGKASAAMARAVEDHWEGPLSGWW